jgi:hypothetical protein
MDRIHVNHRISSRLILFVFDILSGSLTLRAALESDYKKAVVSTQTSKKTEFLVITSDKTDIKETVHSVTDVDPDGDEKEADDEYDESGEDIFVYLNQGKHVYDNPSSFLH